MPRSTLMTLLVFSMSKKYIPWSFDFIDGLSGELCMLWDVMAWVPFHIGLDAHNALPSAVPKDRVRLPHERVVLHPRSFVSQRRALEASYDLADKALLLNLVCILVDSGLFMSFGSFIADTLICMFLMELSLEVSTFKSLNLICLLVALGLLVWEDPIQRSNLQPTLLLGSVWVIRWFNSRQNSSWSVRLGWRHIRRAILLWSVYNAHSGFKPNLHGLNRYWPLALWHVHL